MAAEAEAIMAEAEVIMAEAGSTGALVSMGILTTATRMTRIITTHIITTRITIRPTTHQV
jgi:hypothetical protein